MGPMPRYARTERTALADTLLAAGPEAPTLCAGWTARDLAAHLALRERRPDAAVGILVRPLAGWTGRVQRDYRDGRPYEELVDLVRHGAWWSPLNLPPVDEVANTIEFFVHTEDVRRARPGWQPRTLDPGLSERLWRRVRPLAAGRLRRIGATIRVEAPGHGAFTVGDGAPTVTMSGDPGELLLFFFGRQRAAEVALKGPEELIGMIRGTRFSV